MREVVIVPTYKRNHYLWACLRRIREQDENIEIVVFSDRGHEDDDLWLTIKEFDARLRIMPQHEYWGNSFCVLEALRWAYDERRFHLIHYVEDDAMMHPDCLDWHRMVHDECDFIFAACGWIFNHHAPITNDIVFANWYYAPNASFRREKLKLFVEHATPLYYNAMRDYALKTFPKSFLHNRDGIEDTSWFEQDAIAQLTMEKDRTQAAWCQIAKIDHVGTFGYNKPSGLQFEGSLQKRVAQLEEFIADPYWRMSIFGRPIVEREVGQELPKREFHYKIKIPDGWECDFVSDLERKRLPRHLFSVPLPPNTEIVLS